MFEETVLLSQTPYQFEHLIWFKYSNQLHVGAWLMGSWYCTSQEPMICATLSPYYHLILLKKIKLEAVIISQHENICFLCCDIV